jgi:dolichol-phosphate mannosyltransferase
MNDTIEEQSKSSKSLFILMPTYNELVNLKELIPLIEKTFVENKIRGALVVVDDNSPDKTFDYIKNHLHEFETDNFKVDILLRPAKLGLGTAYIDGYNYIIQKYNPYYILGMDADFSHDPKYIKPLYDLLQNTQMVIGSRYVKGGGVQNWKLFRRLISKGASLYTQAVLNWPIKDPTTAYVGFQVSALKTIPYQKIKTQGYGFLSELKYMAFKAGLTIGEYPIIFTDRREGHSKLSKKVIAQTIINMLFLRFKKYK